MQIMATWWNHWSWEKGLPDIQNHYLGWRDKRGKGFFYLIAVMHFTCCWQVWLWNGSRKRSITALLSWSESRPHWIHKRPWHPYFTWESQKQTTLGVEINSFFSPSFYSPPEYISRPYLFCFSPFLFGLVIVCLTCCLSPILPVDKSAAWNWL